MTFEVWNFAKIMWPKSHKKCWAEKEENVKGYHVLFGKMCSYIKQKALSKTKQYKRKIFFLTWVEAFSPPLMMRKPEETVMGKFTTECYSLQFSYKAFPWSLLTFCIVLTKQIVQIICWPKHDYHVQKVWAICPFFHIRTQQNAGAVTAQSKSDSLSQTQQVKEMTKRKWSDSLRSHCNKLKP